MNLLCLKEMKFRIIESIYYNEYGKEKSKYYYIQEQKSFLWIKYWSDITHRENYIGDCYNVTTQFKSHSDAYDFVKDVLCVQNKRNDWKNTVINHIDY